MDILKKIILMTLPFAICGCEEDFFPKLDVTPVLCINSLITAGETIEVSVSHTWVYTDNDARKNHSVNDAEVSIYANGILQPADYIPCEGDRIRICADSRKYGHAEAEVTVPVATQISEARWDAVIIAANHPANPTVEMYANLTFDISIEIDIPDTNDKTEYYIFESGYFEPGNDNPFGIPATEWAYFSPGTERLYDPIFTEHITDFEQVMDYSILESAFFTDRRFNGRIYPLRISFESATYRLKNNTWDPTRLECGYILTLYSISESYYGWLNYCWQSQNGLLGELAEVGLSEPMWGYSNVSTGAGVVAARSASTYRLDLQDFLEKNVLRK